MANQDLVIPIAIGLLVLMTLGSGSGTAEIPQSPMGGGPGFLQDVSERPPGKLYHEESEGARYRSFSAATAMSATSQQFSEAKQEWENATDSGVAMLEQCEQVLVEIEGDREKVVRATERVQHDASRENVENLEEEVHHFELAYRDDAETETLFKGELERGIALLETNLTNPSFIYSTGESNMEIQERKRLLHRYREAQHELASCIETWNNVKDAAQHALDEHRHDYKENRFEETFDEEPTFDQRAITVKTVDVRQKLNFDASNPENKVSPHKNEMEDNYVSGNISSIPSVPVEAGGGSFQQIQKLDKRFQAASHLSLQPIRENREEETPSTPERAAPKHRVIPSGSKQISVLMTGDSRSPPGSPAFERYQKKYGTIPQAPKYGGPADFGDLGSTSGADDALQFPIEQTLETYLRKGPQADTAGTQIKQWLAQVNELGADTSELRSYVNQQRKRINLAFSFNRTAELAETMKRVTETIIPKIKAQLGGGSNPSDTASYQQTPELAPWKRKSKPRAPRSAPRGPTTPTQAVPQKSKSAFKAQLQRYQIEIVEARGDSDTLEKILARVQATAPSGYTRGTWSQVIDNKANLVYSTGGVTVYKEAIKDPLFREYARTYSSIKALVH